MNSKLCHQTLFNILNRRICLRTQLLKWIAREQRTTGSPSTVVGASNPQLYPHGVWDEVNVLQECHYPIGVGMMISLMHSIGEALQGQYTKKWKISALLVVIVECTNIGKGKGPIQDVSASNFVQGAFKDT